MQFEFEWDPPKNEKCLKLRKFDFAFAAKVFRDQNIKIEIDDRKNYGELRCKALGKIGDRVYWVVFTRRENKIRIISAWKVRKNSKDERRYYGIS